MKYNIYRCSIPGLLMLLYVFGCGTADESASTDRNILTKDDSVDAAYVRRISGQISSLLATGRQVVIITSGAIGMGAGQLQLAEKVGFDVIRQQENGRVLFLQLRKKQRLVLRFRDWRLEKCAPQEKQNDSRT